MIKNAKGGCFSTEIWRCEQMHCHCKADTICPATTPPPSRALGEELTMEDAPHIKDVSVRHRITVLLSFFIVLN